jgi:hypothetical protein
MGLVASRSVTPWLLGGVFVLAGVGAVHALSTAVGCRPTVKAGDRVLLVGDSLAVGLSTPFREICAKAGCEFQALAKSGTRIIQWLQGQRRADLQATIDRYQPTLVLVCLGTNDSYGSDSEATLAKHVADLNGWLSQHSSVLWIRPPKLPKPDKVSPAVVEQGIPAFDSSVLPIPQPDGIHSTGRGYAGWAEHVWASVTCSAAPAQALSGVSAPRLPPVPSFMRPARPGAAKPEGAAKVKVLRKAAKRRRAKKRGWRI